MVTRGNFGTGHLGFVHWIGNTKEAGNWKAIVESSDNLQGVKKKVQIFINQFA